MACDRCEDLRDEISFLKRELGLLRSADKECQLRTSLGLTNHEAAIVELLHRRRGAVVSKGSIWDSLYAGGKSEPDLKIVDVFVCRIRRRLQPGAIATVWGRGFALTPIGLKQVDDALSGLCKQQSSTTRQKDCGVLWRTPLEQAADAVD